MKKLAEEMKRWKDMKDTLTCEIAREIGLKLDEIKALIVLGVFTLPPKQSNHFSHFICLVRYVKKQLKLKINPSDESTKEALTAVREELGTYGDNNDLWELESYLNSHVELFPVK